MHTHAHTVTRVHMFTYTPLMWQYAGGAATRAPAHTRRLIHRGAACRCLRLTNYGQWHNFAN